MLTAQTLHQLLDQLGGLLAERETPVEVVAIGGGGLLLLGYIKRPTRDLDLVAVIDGGGLRRADPMPDVLRAAIDDVARLNGLDSHWMNAAPSSLVDLGLPSGFMSRAIRRQHGALVLHLASREDQIAFKLYAAVDQGPDSKHVADLNALAPTGAELLVSARWAVTHDVSSGFREQLVQALSHFGVDDDGSF
ncbi:MAG: hypothetical protein IT381_32755 [Deltaproteobacteria bacterium]|nr:hypothetical protein [Deltaproteobacteria bacterium]